MGISVSCTHLHQVLGQGDIPIPSTGTHIPTWGTVVSAKRSGQRHRTPHVGPWGTLTAENLTWDSVWWDTGKAIPAQGALVRGPGTEFVLYSPAFQVVRR